jgi:hypothetical protein
LGNTESKVAKISARDQTEFPEISADRLSFIARAEIGERMVEPMVAHASI